jgi:hypothetical protein
MTQAIGNHKVCRMQSHIVPGNLVKDILGNPLRRRFAFDQYGNAAVRVENNHIVTLAKLVYLQLFFNINMAAGIVPVLQEVLNHILPHPFFGLQSHKLFADRVEDLAGIFAIFETELVKRKVQLLHRAK